jgi:hypothetical protein
VRDHAHAGRHGHKILILADQHGADSGCVFPNVAVARVRHSKIGDVCCLVSEGNKWCARAGGSCASTRKRTSGGTDHGMIDVLRGIFERGRDVILLQIRKILQNFGSGGPTRQHVENVFHPYS